MRGRLTQFIIFLFVPVIFASLAVSSFAEDFISGYHLEGKFLLLGETLRGSDGNIKPFAQLSPTEIATIYHEMWHAYFIEYQTKEKGELFRKFRGEVDRIYPSFPSDKRLEVHEEAVADFIDAVIATTVQIRRFLDSHSREKNLEIIEKSNLINLYGKLFSDSYTGYYTRSVKGGNSPASSVQSTSDTMSGGDNRFNSSSLLATFALDPRKSLAPFVTDARKSGLPVKYIVEASQRIRGVVFINNLGWPLPVTNPALVASPVALTSATLATAKVPTPLPGTKPPVGAQSEVSLPIEKGLLKLLEVKPCRPDSSLQADVVMSQTPLSREDMKLVEKELFEGLLPENPRLVFHP